MDAIILLILLLIVFLFTCKGKFEKYSLNFPKINKLKCKCDLKSKSKVKEGFADYKNSDKKYPNQLDRIYHIWKPINDVTAESFYENKYSYPFFPENGNDKKISVKSYNSKDYENLGLKNQKVLPKSYKNGFSSSYQYTFGLQYEP